MEPSEKQQPGHRTTREIAFDEVLVRLFSGRKGYVVMMRAGAWFSVRGIRSVSLSFATW
jgi:hypothetical protein